VCTSHLKLAVTITLHPFNLSYSKDFACQEILLCCSIHKRRPCQLHPSSLVLGSLQPHAAEDDDLHCKAALLLPLEIQQERLQAGAAEQYYCCTA
jgi:hypothetical protein